MLTFASNKEASRRLNWPCRDDGSDFACGCSFSCSFNPQWGGPLSPLPHSLDACCVPYHCLLLQFFRLAKGVKNAIRFGKFMPTPFVGRVLPPPPLPPPPPPSPPPQPSIYAGANHLYISSLCPFLSHCCWQFPFKWKLMANKQEEEEATKRKTKRKTRVSALRIPFCVLLRPRRASEFAHLPVPVQRLLLLLLLLLVL